MLKEGERVRVIANDDRLREIFIIYCSGKRLRSVDGEIEGIFPTNDSPVVVYFEDLDTTYSFEEKDLARIDPVASSPVKSTDKKETNPKDALGIKKVSPHTVPAGVILELALAMTEGGRKYGTYNYRASGVRSSVYYDACLRHLMSWWEGVDIDPDSGIPHIVKAIACLTVLRDSQRMGNNVDDRPIRNPLSIEELNRLTVKLSEKYPECAKPYLESDNVGRQN